MQHTAVTLQPGKFEGRVQTDLIMNRGGGLNVSGHFRAGIIEDMFDLEGFAGTGKTDFKIGALGQFNLLPDIPGQLGLAFLGGFTDISDDYQGSDNDTINVLSLAAIASKKLDVSFGTLTPYGGLQLEMLFKSGDNEYPITGIAGAEWFFTETAPFTYFTEFDFDINDSVFLLGLGAAYHF